MRLTPGSMIGSVAAAALLMSACSSPKTSDSLYADSEAGTSKQVVRCRVLEVREVAIREDNAGDKGETIGAIVGGIAGAILGSRVGGGSGREAAVKGGAIGGAVIAGAAGRQTADKLSERKGLEYSIVLASGEERTLVQDFLEDDRIVQPGETCRLQIANDGRNRVLPAEHLPATISAPKKTTVTN